MYINITNYIVVKAHPSKPNQLTTKFQKFPLASTIKIKTKIMCAFPLNCLYLEGR